MTSSGRCAACTLPQVCCSFIVSCHSSSSFIVIISHHHSPSSSLPNQASLAPVSDVLLRGGNSAGAFLYSRVHMTPFTSVRTGMIQRRLACCPCAEMASTNREMVPEQNMYDRRAVSALHEGPHLEPVTHGRKCSESSFVNEFAGATLARYPLQAGECVSGICMWQRPPRPAAQKPSARATPLFTAAGESTSASVS